MPNILSEEFFLSKYRHSSLYLGKTDIPVERDAQSLRYALEERIHPDKGSLLPAEAALKAAEYAWSKWNGSQRIKMQHPIGNFLEKINDCKARITVLKEEILFLDKAIDKLESQQESKEAEDMSSRKYRLAGHLDANGQYDFLDGRACKAGIFQDNGESVESYTKEAMKFKAEQAAIKRKAAAIAATVRESEIKKADKEFDQKREAA